MTPSDSPLPLLAPPPFQEIPRAPACREEEAERRILSLRERELQERIADGLALPAEESQEPVVTSAAVKVDDDDEMLWKAVDDLECDGENGRVDLISQQPDKSPSQLCVTKIELGIQEDLRGDIIEWLLDVSILLSHLAVPLTFISGHASGLPLEAIVVHQSTCTARRLSRNPVARRPSVHAILPSRWRVSVIFPGCCRQEE